MKDFKIRVMALKGLDQIELKEINVQGADNFDFCIGNVGDFFPLDRGTRIEVWVTSEDTKTQP